MLGQLPFDYGASLYEALPPAMPLSSPSPSPSPSPVLALRAPPSQPTVGGIVAPSAAPVANGNGVARLSSFDGDDDGSEALSGEMSDSALDLMV